jgi:hypothetical protein
MKLADAFKASMACHNPQKPDYETPYAYLESWQDPESGIAAPVAVYYWAGTWRGIHTPSYPHYGDKLMRMKEADAYFGHREDWKPYLEDNVLNVGPQM